MWLTELLRGLECRVGVMGSALRGSPGLGFQALYHCLEILKSFILVKAVVCKGTMDQEVGVCALAHVLRPTACLFLGSGSQLLCLLSPTALAALSHPLPTFTQQPLPACPQPGARHGGGGVSMPTPQCLGVGHGGCSPCPTLAESGCIHRVFCRDKPLVPLFPGSGVSSAS